MSNTPLYVGTTLILLVFIAGGLAVIVVSNQKTVAEAKAFGQVTLDYFKKIGKKCDARSNEFPQITLCLEELRQELGVVGELKEESFTPFNPKKNETGFIVLENKGRKTLNSTAFFLYKNHVVADEGCVIEGSIDPGYLCRLEFNTTCEKGDVLEVTYEEKRAYLKTC